jgi:hypothetical protein
MFLLISLAFNLTWEKLFPNLATLFFDILITVLVVDFVIQFHKKKETIALFKKRCSGFVNIIAQDLGHLLCDFTVNTSGVPENIYFYPDIEKGFLTTLKHLEYAWIINTKNTYITVQRAIYSNRRKIHEFLNSYIPTLPEEVITHLVYVITLLDRYDILSKAIYTFVEAIHSAKTEEERNHQINTLDSTIKEMLMEQASIVLSINDQINYLFQLSSKSSSIRVSDRWASRKNIVVKEFPKTTSSSS